MLDVVGLMVQGFSFVEMKRINLKKFKCFTIFQVIITSVTSAVNDKKSDSSTNISEDDTNEVEDDVKDDEKMSTVTCQSCSRCNQPLTRGVEKERFISRMV